MYLTVTRKPSETGKVQYTNLSKNYLLSEDELKKGRREDENSFKIEEDSEEEYRITTANHREPRNKMSLKKKKTNKTKH